MIRIVLTSLIACAAALVSGSIHAQATATPPPAGGTADGMPFDIPYGTPISLETAKKLIAAVETEAVKHRWKMNIAVVDTNGDLVHFARMDGAQLASINISQGKARTAARYRRETRVSTTLLKPGIPTSQRLIPHSSPRLAAYL
jgi:glc operon protein GlcG